MVFLEQAMKEKLKYAQNNKSIVLYIVFLVYVIMSIHVVAEGQTRIPYLGNGFRDIISVFFDVFKLCMFQSL